MSRLGTFGLSVVLVTLIVTAYWPVRSNEFIDLDDELYITNNPPVMQGLSWSGFRWAWTTDHGHYWQPIAWLSLQADAQLFSRESPLGDPILSPAAFHGQNLFWHAASAVLLFLLLQRLTGAGWSSFLMAALFALHPLRVESVAWAAERKDVLCVFFGILTLWAYVRYCERPGRLRYLLLIAAYVLSLSSKPMLLTLPFVLLLLDYWPLARTASRRRLLLEKVPLLILATVIGVITYRMREQTGSIVSMSELPLSARVGNALVAYGWYLSHTFYPTNLAAFYPHPYGNWSVLAALAGLAALLLLSGLALWQVRRRRWLIVGWLWFVGTLLPVIGLAQGGSQAWADRFTYWPQIGLLVAIVWGLRELVVRSRISMGVCGTVAAGVIVALMLLTQQQARHWHDTEALWDQTFAVTTDNHTAHVCLGRYYLNQGRLDRAKEHFAEAVRICPDCAEYRYCLGTTHLDLGNDDQAAAQFREAVGREPNNIDAWHNLGLARLREGHTESAVLCFRKVLELDATADTQAMLGQALWRLGERAEALHTFEEVLERQPQQVDACLGLATAYLTEGHTEDAAAVLSSVVQRAPYSVRAWSDLGVAYGRQGRWSDAVAAHRCAVQLQEQGEAQRTKMGGRAPAPDGIPQAVWVQCRLAFAQQRLGNQRAAAQLYQAALRRDPTWPRQFADKSRRLATDENVSCRDPQLACELAGQAVEALADPPAIVLDALAVAQVSRGEFAAAVATEERALKRASATAADAALAHSIRDRLDLFKEGRFTAAALVSPP